MKRFGIIIKPSNQEAVKTACELSAWITGKGCAVYAGKDAGLISNVKAVPHDKLPENIDIMIVLGGDGTMIAAARLLDGKKIPILGVNLGGLGFLTAITTGEMYSLIERVINDDFKVEERMKLTVEHTRNGRILSIHKVLNDAVIKCASARLIRLETKINREYVTTYRADGLIVATPTGSTAYSLSAAGPILYPTIHSIIVSPICPFNLTNRPVVIPDWMTVDVKVGAEHSNVQLILDGQVDVSLDTDDIIKIKRAEESVYLIRYEGKSYFDILRERLMWELKTEIK